MIAWLRRAWTRLRGARYLARRRRDTSRDQRYADELQAARDGISPRPPYGA
ncbi:MAG: hypothetical protein JOZ82_11495 [Marmoricola sp.]|nr:hypothetical protein [Marmoricola sp.]